MVIYCDSCILIYFFDHTGSWNHRSSERLSQLASAGDLIATSDLVRMECRVKPMDLGDSAKLAIFDAFFERLDIHRVAITTAIFDLATEIRARNHFKLGDSLHLAAAVVAGCDTFLTNDNRLALFTGIKIEVLP